MIVPKQNKLAVAKLWNDYENYLMQIFEAMLNNYVKELKPTHDEFSAAKQQIEFI